MIFSPQVIPVSAVVATCDRAPIFVRTLRSLAAQNILPAEVIVVDGSKDEATRLGLDEWAREIAPHCAVRWLKAEVNGAATQRNQGIREATRAFLWVFDDDILFEENCVDRLWKAIECDPALGGVSAMITNQRYSPPGLPSQIMFRIMAGYSAESYAGRVLGPAVNLLPEDRDDLPEVVAVEWLNTTCTIYRSEALPCPAFPAQFTGYSLMEDLTLSLTVGKKWKLANVRTACIFHDSQPGSHKSDPSVLAEMAIVNRYYVMDKILGRRGWHDFIKLILWTLFLHAASLRSPAHFRLLPSQLRGEWRGLLAIRTHHRGAV